MKKYFVDETISYGDNRKMRGYYITVDGNQVTLEVPSDVPGDKTNLYEETIDITKFQTFNAYHSDISPAVPVHWEDGDLSNSRIHPSRKCFCGNHLEWNESDTAGGIEWFGCPSFLNGNTDHDSIHEPIESVL